MTDKGRGFSTRFEDHIGLLHTFARKMHSRAKAAGALIEYDDVFGELCVAFAAAQKKYDPSRGITFTAYLGASCYNRFNKFAEKWIGEQLQFGLLRFAEIDHIGSGAKEDGRFDILAHADRSYFEDIRTQSRTPEEIAELKQEFYKNVRKLSPDSREYVTSLLGRRTNDRKKPFTEKQARQIKQELLKVYGVTVNQLRK